MSDGPVWLLGDINLDVIMPIDSYPAPGGDKRSERTVIESGGSAANTAVLLAHCGLSVEMLGCVGDDVLAELALERLRGAGVGTDHVQQAQQENTGMMFIPVTPDGQRTIFGRRGANLHLQAESLPPRAITQGRALHLSGYSFLEGTQVEAAEAALGLAKQEALFTSMDTAYEPPMVVGDRLWGALPGLDLLVIGEPEAEALTGTQGPGQLGADLLSAGVHTVAIKRGREGSELFREAEHCFVPLLPVKTVDTTGAGDSYSGALLFGLLNGLSLPATGALATAAGALATTVWGAGAQLPSLSSILTLLAAPPPVQGAPNFADAAHEAVSALS